MDQWVETDWKINYLFAKKSHIIFALTQLCYCWLRLLPQRRATVTSVSEKLRSNDIGDSKKSEKLSSSAVSRCQHTYETDTCVHGTVSASGKSSSQGSICAPHAKICSCQSPRWGIHDSPCCLWVSSSHFPKTLSVVTVIIFDLCFKLCRVGYWI